MEALDDESKGNVAMARAMLANQRGEARLTEEYARRALGHFHAIRLMLRTGTENRAEQDVQEQNSNDLSGARTDAWTRVAGVGEA